MFLLRPASLRVSPNAFTASNVCSVRSIACTW